MIPIKDKKYMLNCQGPYDYNRYMGEGVFTGESTRFEIDETGYGFIIPTCGEVCFFLEEEIVAEFTDDNQVRPLVCDLGNYSEDYQYSQIEVRKLIQKALQNDHLSKHEKICDLNWLLYRIRLGGGCIRMFANINALFRSNETLTKEKFKEFEEKFIKHINEEYEQIL
jgi:hypothetical protein